MEINITTAQELNTFLQNNCVFQNGNDGREYEYEGLWLDSSGDKAEVKVMIVGK